MKGGRGLRQFDPDDMPFQVVEWDREHDRPHQILAASVNVTFAGAAYDAAVAHEDYGRAGKQILLMQGARVMRDSEKVG